MNDAPLIGRLVATLNEQSDVVCAWLFGSRARGDARPGSDLDVAVLLDPEPAPTLAESSIARAGALEDSLGLPVDLIIVNRAPIDLVHRILRDGRLLVDRSPAARVRFEVLARSRWFDMKPILDEYRRARPAVDG